MKPLPNLSNEGALIERGKRSLIASARNDAAEALRDACTRVQSADWGDIREHADAAIAAAERLKTVAAMWDEV